MYYNISEYILFEEFFMKKYLISTIAGTIVAMAVGYLWYSPWLFGNLWLSLTQVTITPEYETVMFIKGILLSLFTASILTYIVSLIKGNITKVLWVIFLGWLGFCIPLGLQCHIYAGEAIQLFAINAGYNFVTYMLIAITAWYINKSV